MRDLNSRPMAHKTNTLPTELMEPYVNVMFFNLIDDACFY